MKRSFADAFRCADLALLRTPLLPLETYVAWGDGLEAAHASEPELEAALARDRERLQERLRAIVSRPEVAEALFVSSPSFHDALGEWIERPGSERGEKLAVALARFVGRMTTRPTPFGLFGGCTVLPRGERTALVLGPLATYRRAAWLDLHWVATLVGALGRDLHVRAALRFEPTSSLYRANGRVHYAEIRAGAHGEYDLALAEDSDALAVALRCAVGGAVPADIAKAIVASDPEVDDDDAAAFVAELIDQQLLVPTLAPALTSALPGRELAAELAACGAAPAVARQLQDAERALRALNEAPLGLSAARYRAIEHALPSVAALGADVAPLHVHLWKPATAASFGPDLVAAALEAAALLHRLAYPSTDLLESFRTRFLERFEQRHVPLVDVLDAGRGLGFATTASDVPAGFERAAAFAAARDPSEPLRWRTRDAHLLHRIEEASERGERELSLREIDLEVLAPPPGRVRPLPDGFAVQASWVDAPGAPRRPMGPRRRGPGLGASARALRTHRPGPAGPRGEAPGGRGGAARRCHRRRGHAPPRWARQPARGAAVVGRLRDSVSRAIDRAAGTPDPDRRSRRVGGGRARRALVTAPRPAACSHA